MKKQLLVLFAFTLMYKVFAQTSDNPKWEWAGSGFAISERFVATNYHVVDGAKVTKISGISGDFTKKYDVEVVASDKNNDLAILKVIDKNFSGFSDIPYIINPDNVDVGTEIFVLGYPLTFALGQEVKVTNGIISSKTGFQNDVTCYQMTAPIQAGNSGGPVFDYKGNMIAISVAGINSGIAEKVLYSVKSSYLKNLAESCTEKIPLPQNNRISSLSLAEKVKKVSPYVVHVEVYEGTNNSSTAQSSLPNSEYKTYADQLLYSAQKKFMNRDYIGAFADISESIRLCPTPRAHFIRAELALYVKDTSAALESYKYCVDNKYNLKESRNRLAYCYILLGKFDMAVELYNILILEDSRDLDALFMRAHCKDTLGDKSAAILDYIQILKYEGAIDFDYGTVYNNLAYIYVRGKNYEMAKKYISMALERNKMEWYIWDTDGELAYRTGDYIKCIKSMNNAIAIDGSNDNSYFYRGMAKLKVGEMLGAKFDLENAKVLNNKQAADSLLLIDITKLNIDNLMSNNDKIIVKPKYQYYTDRRSKMYGSYEIDVKSVEITAEYTAVTFTVEARWRDFFFSVHKDLVLHVETTSAKEREDYPLLSVRNCSIYPKQSKVAYNDKTEIVLIFPSINRNCKKITLEKAFDGDDCPWIIEIQVSNPDNNYNNRYNR